MSLRKEELIREVQKLTWEGCRDALYFLCGYDSSCTKEAVDFVKQNYPWEYRKDHVE